MLTQQISLINLHRRLIHMPNFQLTKPINAMWTKTENTESEKKHHHRIIIIISTYHTLAYRSKEHHRIITDSPTSEKRCVTLSVSGKRKKAQKTHKHKVKKTKLKRAKNGNFAFQSVRIVMFESYICFYAPAMHHHHQP